MKSKNLTISSTILIISIFTIGIIFAGTLSPSASPNSTFYSLNDIYNLVASSTNPIVKGSGPNSSIATSSIPTSTTTHSTSEIYALLANMVKRENILTGYHILGVTGNWGVPDPDYATVTQIFSSRAPSVSSNTATGYTLEDIYRLVATSSSIKAIPHSSTNAPLTAPSASMHTTTDVYEAIISLKSFLAGVNKIGMQSTYLGVEGNIDPVYMDGENCSESPNGLDCISGYCSPATSVCAPIPTKQLDESCEYNEQCSTSFCGQGVCTNGISGVDPCSDGSQCIDGFCSNYSTGICSTGADGELCYFDYDCSAGFCNSDGASFPNYSPTYKCNDPTGYGCTDSCSLNYNPEATGDDGSCNYDGWGCTDINASNYNSSAICEDDSCQYLVLGCTDPDARNYNPDAEEDDGTCEPKVDLNQYCESAQWCISNYCVWGRDFIETGFCTSGLDGDYCMNTNDCESTYCFFDGVMAQGVCSSGAEGEPCLDGGSCMTGDCVGANASLGVVGECSGY